MHIQHLKGIPQTIPKDHTDDHETCTVSKKQTNKQKTLSFPSLPTTTAKKPIPTSVTVDLLSSPSATANLHFI